MCDSVHGSHANVCAARAVSFVCRACNRLGIDSTTSPLLKMTFETAAKFLTDAALTGDRDSLTSPAACLVVGAVTEVGTGCCQLLHEGL